MFDKVLAVLQRGCRASWLAAWGAWGEGCGSPSAPQSAPWPLVLGLGCLREMRFLLKINMGSGDPIPSLGGFSVCSWHVNPTALQGTGKMLCGLLLLGPGPRSPWGCGWAHGAAPQLAGFGGMSGPLSESPHTTWGGDVSVLLLRDARRLQLFCQMSCRSHMLLQGPEPPSCSENSHFFRGWGLCSVPFPKSC